MSTHKIDDLVGIAEIADELGVKKQAVANWPLRHADFPQPLKRLAMGPIYDMAEVRVWYATRRSVKYAKMHDAQVS